MFSSFTVSFDTVSQPWLSSTAQTDMINYVEAADCICGEVVYTVTNSPLPSFITANPLNDGKFSLLVSDVKAYHDSSSEVVSLLFTV